LTRLYPGVQAALMRLGKDGVKLAVATNKPHDLAVAILDAVGIATRFGVIVGSVPGLELKPAPAILRKALTELGGTPDRAVMVGDSRADVGAAKAARCRSIVFGHGYSEVPVSTLGADAVCARFADLPVLVSRLLPD
jgi:phosphoglycolate phosphatase